MQAKIFDMPGYLEGMLQVHKAERDRRKLASGVFHDAIDRMVFAARFWFWVSIAEAALLLGVTVYWIW